MLKQIETVGDVSHFRQEWKKLVQNVVKGEFVKPVSMVNKGYLHALNASFDGLFLREQQSNSLLIADHPMNFGTAQPCVRTEDRLKDPLHLGLFEIWGTSVLGFEPTTPDQMAEKTVREFLIFYTDYLGLNPQDLRVHYFGGASLKDLTRGHSPSNDYVQPDDFSANIWGDHGISAAQLIPEYSNETFLLHQGNPLRAHHSGYRNDIFIEAGNQSYEIATLNYISHQSVVENDQVIAIKPLPFYLREIAFGQERVLVAINDSADLFTLPYIAPLVERAAKDLEDPSYAKIFADALRVVHYVVSDGWTLDKLGGRKYREHRQELRGCLKAIMESKQTGEANLRELLMLNANLQPWHPGLESGIAATAQQIISYQNRS